LELAPKAFALLRHLVEHPQRLITKDDLLAAVWRDAIVSDAALTSCVRDLRKALGDSALFERARAIATELGMRPLVARCHLGLGALSRRIGNDRQAREHLTTAAALFGEMGMRFWHEQAVSMTAQP
jgi:hypothetical protein